MPSKTKTLFFLMVVAVGGYSSFRIYTYFTHAIPPQFELRGVTDGNCYKNFLECSIEAHSDNNVSNIFVTVDGKQVPAQLTQKRNGTTAKSLFPFSVDLTELENGNHELEVKVVDGSYRQNATVKKVTFAVDSEPLKASLVEPSFVVDQGRCAHARIALNKRAETAYVEFLAQQYPCFPEAQHSNVYECYIPVSCEQQEGDYQFKVHLTDPPQNTLSLTGKVSVKAFPFKRARGFVVERSKLENEKDLSLSDKTLELALEKNLEHSPQEKLWSGSFELPINVQRTVTPFGEIRTTAEKGRYYHAAVDLVNHPRSVVWASARGKVILKERFLMSGNTVAIDHGHGICSLYYHLDDFAPGLEVGEVIKKGNPIGRLGKTGYASGYHLHWELRVKNIPVDPLQWTDKAF